MTNIIGSGPPAVVNRRTAVKNETTTQTIISLILVGNLTVDLSSGNNPKTDKTIYTNDRRIVGTAIHVARNLLFVADEAQFIYRITMGDPQSGRIVVREPRPNDNGAPLQLSMDWLNDYLYFIVEGNQMWWISRCDLYGGAEQVVLSGLSVRPSHFEVDPYNGYDERE